MVLIVAIITLALLGIMALAASDTSLLNILMAANGKNARAAFFLADSGANAGHEYLENAIASVNSTFYSNATNASQWENESVFNPDDYPVKWHRHGSEATHVRAGLMETGLLPGSAIQGGPGYGSGRGTYSSYLIRSHRKGAGGSVAEVDLGWRHINQ
jgi:Tfp pilus assembly protein PilX